jgi:8-oxo-dGTP pyrophosphatase MutT (NUDIX family)
LLLVNVSLLRGTYPTSFIAIFNPSASEQPLYRLEAFEAGVNMVAHDVGTLRQTLTEVVIPAGMSGGHFSCPYCQLKNLSERDMWLHCPTYHINFPNEYPMSNICPICNKQVNRPLQVHIHEHHHPTQEPIPKYCNNLYNFALVICRHPDTHRYLLCQEFASQGFWCPGGAVDPGERFMEAAKRETIEEAGIDIELKGILGIEYNPCGMDRRQTSYFVRMRVIYYAEPSEKGLRQLPKSRPDFESAGACWASFEEIQSNRVKLRGAEPRKWAKYLEDGGMVFPLSLLQEGTG